MRILVAAFVIMATAQLAAHHNAIASDRAHSVTIEGIVEAFVFANPHVEIHIRTDNGVVYTAEWQLMGVLSNDGITRDTLRPGDRVIVRGRPNKVAALRITELAEVKRPADGWTWVSPQHKF
jgi:hypothetical protein